jgi:ParB-like chromosome segregation protein Spo0J
VPIDRIVPSRYRVRHPSTAESLAPLLESLQTPGRVLPPLYAIVHDDGFTFELLDGHRIVEAGRFLGWEDVALLLVSLTPAEAALWTVLSDTHRRRYTWWERMRAMQTFAVVNFGSMTGRDIARLTGLTESTISEARTAAAVLTLDVLRMAGVDEVRDRNQLARLRRRDGRYIVGGGSPEEVAHRLREVLDGRTPDALADREAQERAAAAISSAIHTDGRWRVEVDLQGVAAADLRSIRRELRRRLDEAYGRLLRAPAARHKAQAESLPAGGRVSGVRQIGDAQRHPIPEPEVRSARPMA